MLVRLLMLFVAAAALLAQAPEAFACPAHDSPALHAAAEMPAARDVTPMHCRTVAPSSPLCKAQGAQPLCSHFHLCCVTPPGLPAAEVATVFSAPLREAPCGRLPADTGIHALLDTPPPRS